MDISFYKTARKWYNAIYVNPVNERLYYFLIVVISLICLYFSVLLCKGFFEIKDMKNTYVIFTKHNTKDTSINVTKLHSNKNSYISLLKKIIEKYVINMESLMYSGNMTGMDAIHKKSVIIKNLSSKNVYDNYMGNSTVDGGDVSLAVLKIQKTATIDDIELIYEDVDVFKKFYSKFFFEKKPKGAMVHFTSETTEKGNKKKHYVAVMYFDYLFDIKFGSSESSIDFKVNDYYIDSDHDIS